MDKQWLSEEQCEIRALRNTIRRINIEKNELSKKLEDAERLIQAYENLKRKNDK